MNKQKYTIKYQIDLFKDELKNLYPDYEIESLTYLSLESIFNQSKIQIHSSLNKSITANQHRKLKKILVKLKRNIPVQYILGETEFYGLQFKVNKNVLIPRPETEELTGWIIKENENKKLIILDIGTGSGCIAVSMAKFLKESQVYAGDISKKALKTAKKNAELNKVNINFLKLDILKEKSSALNNLHFNIIVSNPPYIKEYEKEVLPRNVVNNEPHIALFVNEKDPLKFYKKISNFSINRLLKGGKLYVEINEAFGKEVKRIFYDSGFEDVTLRKDINGKDRMVRGIK